MESSRCVLVRTTEDRFVLLETSAGLMETGAGPMETNARLMEICAD